MVAFGSTAGNRSAGRRNLDVFCGGNDGGRQQNRREECVPEAIANNGPGYRDPYANVACRQADDWRHANADDHSPITDSPAQRHAAAGQPHVPIHT